MDDRPLLLLPVELGRLFGVNAKTTLMWVKANRIEAIRTPGGHHRFRPDEVVRVLKEQYEGDELVIRLAELEDLLELKIRQPGT